MTEDSRETATTADPAGFPRQQARTRGFRLGAPRAFTPSPDGRRVVFLRSGGGTDPVTRLWVLDLPTDGPADERCVLDPAALPGASEEDLPPEERARRERLREVTGGVTAYATDEDVTVAVVALSGRPYAVDLVTPGAVPRPLPAPGPVVDPRPDPTGSTVAYVSDRALHVVPLSADPAREDSVRTLAAPDTDTQAWGLADFAAAEELERVRGFWWAPDGERLLVERCDEAPVATWWIADPANPDSAPQQLRYPAAGTANAEVTLWLVGLDGRRTEIRWDSTSSPYLAAVHWSQYGPPLLQVLSRDQRRADVLAVDVATGATAPVRTDTDAAWCDVVPGVPRWTPDGRLLHVVADAPADTYRLAVDGVPLTPPGLQVSAVLDVDDSGALVIASDEPVHAAAHRVSWEGGVTAGSPTTGRWSARTRGGVTVVLGGGPDDTSATATVLRAGMADVVVASHAETPVVAPRVSLLRAGDRAIRTAVLWPTGHVPGSARLPVLLSPYGGPHGQRAVAYSGGHHLMHQWWADQGFCVVVADGAGTPGRGPAFEREVLRDLATPVLADQLTALDDVLAAHPDDTDPGRVGIRGWSFGGFLAALAVLQRPDRFHAAVAGAPVTDWRLYDTAYTERYLGDPTHDPAPYDACSLLPVAASLRRPLLLIHGLADDNVVVAHTLRLSAALLAAGRPHSVLPLSGVTHMTPQEDVAAHQVLLELDFLRGALADPRPV